jgi:hypothetical protein
MIRRFLVDTILSLVSIVHFHSYMGYILQHIGRFVLALSRYSLLVSNAVLTYGI